MLIQVLLLGFFLLLGCSNAIEAQSYHCNPFNFEFRIAFLAIRFVYIAVQCISFYRITFHLMSSHLYWLMHFSLAIYAISSFSLRDFSATLFSSLRHSICWLTIDFKRVRVDVLAGTRLCREKKTKTTNFAF